MNMTASMMMGLDPTPRLANIIPTKFWLKYKPDSTAPGGLKAEEWVEWHVKLLNGQTVQRSRCEAIFRLKKGAEKATEPDDEYGMLWHTIRPHYENWKAGGNAEVINGTPLSIWPAITADVVELLKPFKVQSVEDLSMIGDGLIQKLPHPNMPRYRDMAKKFLATKEIAAAVRDLSDKDHRIEAMEAEMAAMRKALADANFAQREAADAAPDHPLAPKRRKMVAAE